MLFWHFISTRFYRKTTNGFECGVLNYFTRQSSRRHFSIKCCSQFIFFFSFYSILSLHTVQLIFHLKICRSDGNYFTSHFSNAIYIRSLIHSVRKHKTFLKEKKKWIHDWRQILNAIVGLNCLRCLLFKFKFVIWNVIFYIIFFLNAVTWTIVIDRNRLLTNFFFSSNDIPFKMPAELKRTSYNRFINSWMRQAIQFWNASIVVTLVK